jgi:hypothetical protein
MGKQTKPGLAPTKESADSETPSRWTRFKRRLTRLGEWANREKTFTDWCMAAFTLVLAAFAIFQFFILRGQLDTMKKDQRPWVKVSFEPAPIQPLAPIGGTVRLVNNGKTPARNVWFEAEVVRVQNGEQPTFDYPKPYARVYPGIFFPSDPENGIPVSRLRSAADKSTVLDPLTQSEVDDFNKLAVFFVVYGTVHYTDFFNSDHWTKFCWPIYAAHTSGTLTFKACTDYGDIDSN